MVKVGGDNVVNAARTYEKNDMYVDDLQWSDDAKYEAFDGAFVNMAPAPTPRHQQIFVELSVEFSSFLRRKDCQLFTSPLDVCLFAAEEISDENIKNLVQPDIMVV